MLPEKFLEYISQYPVLEPLSRDLLTEPSVSVRVNPVKAPAEAPSSEQVPWCAEGYYLAERPLFTFDPALHQGRYYVQDASSMAIGAAIRQIAPDGPVRYLDACAAPGGKTTCAISALPEGSLVVANEYDFKRAEILAENVAKWGNPNVMVTRGDTSRLARLTEFFDIVAVDAPCSGEGMMRKDAYAREQWSPALVAQCAATQRQILSNVWQALRPGGYLIYSTCTFNLTENEENLSWLISEFGAQPLPIPSLDSLPAIVHGINTPHPCYRFLPGRIRGEGLFLALLRKPQSGCASHRGQVSVGAEIGTGDSPLYHPGPSKMVQGTVPCTKKKKQVVQGTVPCTTWLERPDDWRIVTIGDEVYAQPARWADDMTLIMKKADALMPGLHLATVKGRDLVPAHELALSTALSPTVFPQCEVDRSTAIAYLQRQSLTIDAPKGYVLLTYDGLPLGLVKNLGNRANNLYPKNWRIRSNE